MLWYVIFQNTDKLQDMEKLLGFLAIQAVLFGVVSAASGICQHVQSISTSTGMSASLLTINYNSAWVRTL